MLKWLGGLVDSNEKEIKRLQPLVDEINALEPEFRKLSDAKLRTKTADFKARLKDGETLDELLPEAFAAIREAARRTIHQRHFDVQLMGGIVLHQGKIAEMKTGEGKTLVATLPLYLNALTSQGCHLVTVNDYLARRDPYWMGPIYYALGISVASIYPQQTTGDHTPSLLYDPSFDSGDKRWGHFRPVTRREAYGADITYGTSSEFGFDYLRDNMAIDLSRCVQRLPLNYAIVDEVDNLLIDEARTPLIISGPAEQTEALYHYFARLVTRLHPGVDYEVKEKERSTEPTDTGYANVERILKQEGLLKSASLYDPSNVTLMHHLRNALSAKEFYKKDREYHVTDFKDGNGPQVVIVDEFTGHLMLGRRYSEGLHQAIEAKEHVRVQQETKTLGTITVQNYFRMYQTLAGMTGTAATEAEELHKIYKLEVIVIPTNKPMIREDFPDRIYKDEKTKFKAVVQEIEQLYQQKRPVLIGTVSIEKSEILSDLLKRRGVPHQVLNAKEHTKEAEIIAHAGEPGAVSVATNMAGRGVDIVLGGKEPEELQKPDTLDETTQKHWEQAHAKWEKVCAETKKRHDSVVSLGGLCVIGTERHESRRIDNQLRGRSGRQGNPGSTRFYVSMEDDTVRRFGSDRIKGIMEWVGMDENTPIENKLVNRTIEGAQVRVEGYYFDVRKHLVEYDDVTNQQRKIIYAERQKILNGADLKTNILSMVGDEIQNIVTTHTTGRQDEDWDIEGLLRETATIFPLTNELNVKELAPLRPEQIAERLNKPAVALYEQKEKEVKVENMRMLERLVMLGIVDNLWVEHLTNMEHMRLQAGWESLRQVRPVDAYKNEGYKQFQVLLDTIRHDVVHTIYHVGITRQETPHHTPISPMLTTTAPAGDNRTLPAKSSRKIGRNAPCPCNSGKKYKHCCGK
ncbi:MAG: preprotein translocase subunit SecA [Dehalococcoidales bacterium]|jgi:preprotein translocase subunit SecA|nr:preprotein translocase subunit SecA [Dehalococcoidales bacterium]MDP6737723.1 preprotein translocase subunit SecA [Dehalococcoidales bacterium]